MIEDFRFLYSQFRRQRLLRYPLQLAIMDNRDPKRPFSLKPRPPTKGGFWRSGNED